MSVLVNGEVSHWWRQITPSTHSPSRPALIGDTEADVVVVGAGYTGLWTAYHLARQAPDLRIVVLEERFAGYGASGRNGGWLTNTVTGGPERYVATHGRDAAAAQQRALTDTVYEVVEVARREEIDADIHLGGELAVARSAAQLDRMHSAARAASAWPGTDWNVLGAAERERRVRVAGAVGAMWHPHAARIQPAKLVDGLVGAVERLGVTLYESTRVERIVAGAAHAAAGTVRARHVIRATEGFTARLPGQRRTWLPMNSSLVVTEPISAEVWAEIGWEGREVLGDMAHAYMYAQRTADGRIAFGGRGVPYRYGSRIDTDGQTPASTVQALGELMTRFFPALGSPRLAHAWSGVLGVPRDWSAGVAYDAVTGLGHAGGYVGTGVAATHLAGRTMADLILGHDTERSRLPWVGHRTRRWEPEPLRWMGVQTMYAAYRAADRAEDARRRTTSPLARLADRVSGR